MKISEIITDKYKLRIPPTVYYDLLADVQEAEEEQESQSFKWCTGCKEYDQEKHCCHRWSKVIRDTVEEMKQEPRKGKWVHREDMDYLDKNNATHNHFMCSKCGFIHDFIDGHTSQYSYCPNCGAKMVGHRKVRDK